MRATRTGAILGAAVLVIGAAAGIAYAQGMGMGQSGMMPMGTMMNHMRQVMGETSQMVDNAQNNTMMGHGTMHGSSGMMGTGNGATAGPQAMMGMVQGTDSMARSMQELMQQMQTLMGNQSLMQNQGFAQHMQQMQRNMTTMMQGFDGFVDNVKAVQQQQQPSK